MLEFFLGRLSVALFPFLAHPLSPLMAETKSVSEDRIILATTDFWCPVMCRGDVPKKGTFFEMARKIWPKKEILVRNYSFLRAKDLVLKGAVTAFPAILKKEIPSLIYPETPGSVVKFCVYGHPEVHFEYRGVPTLAGKKLGIVKEYGYPSSIRGLLKDPKKHGVTIDRFFNKNPLVALSRAAHKKEIDFFIEDEWVVSYGLLTNQLADVESKGCIEDGIDFGQFGISPKLPYGQKLAKEWDEGVRRLKASGELKKIFSRYGVPDWEALKL